MADNTAIEWTDATWNPITGCSVISPGCTNCYAMKLAGTRLRNTPSRTGLTIDSKAGPVWNGQVRLNEQWLTQPLRWKKPRKIFVCAHGDLFHENVPDEWIDKVFAVMALAPQHQFQVLTKRAARMRDYLTDQDLNNRISAALGNMLDGDWIWQEGERFRDRIDTLIDLFLGESTDDEGDLTFHDDPMPLPNVWLGVSVEDQQRANERIPLLLQTPAAIRFISAEPLLGPINLRRINTHGGWYDSLAEWRDVKQSPAPEGHLDWVIAGGESGPNARPMHPDWERSLRDQCAAVGVAFFLKQNGEYVSVSEVEGPGEHFKFFDGVTVRRVGKKAAGNFLDGRQHLDFPTVDGSPLKAGMTKGGGNG